jgi:hypothetical protein
MLAPLATAAAVDGFAADRTTGIGPAAAGAWHVASIKRRAVERLAGLDAGAALHHAGIEGLAADRATGNGPSAAARHVEGRGTSPASSGSRRSASPGSPAGLTPRWRPPDRGGSCCVGGNY